MVRIGSNPLDAIEAGIQKLVFLTEHVPVQDVMYRLAAAREAGTRVLAPNIAGATVVATPTEIGPALKAKLG